jgi:hypothetical protein
MLLLVFIFSVFSFLLSLPNIILAILSPSTFAITFWRKLKKKNLFKFREKREAKGRWDF